MFGPAREASGHQSSPDGANHSGKVSVVGHGDGDYDDGSAGDNLRDYNGHGVLVCGDDKGKPQEREGGERSRASKS
jgi:hypothetical protein